LIFFDQFIYQTNSNYIVEDDLSEWKPTARSFGCYGLFNKNDYQCYTHCKNTGHQGGRCDAASQWFTCVCY